jgi:diacylglycerol kinase family enzyme
VSEIKLAVDGQPPVHTHGHIVLAANMLFVGPRFRVDPNSVLDDSLLDLVVYADLSKMDLLGSVIQSATGGAEDQRILRYKVRRVTVDTNPPMPVIVDGFPLENTGRVRLSVRRLALNIVAAQPVAAPAAAAPAAAAPAETQTAADTKTTPAPPAATEQPAPAAQPAAAPPATPDKAPA